MAAWRHSSFVGVLEGCNIQKLNLLNEINVHCFPHFFPSPFLPFCWTGYYKFPAECEYLQKAAPGRSSSSELWCSELSSCLLTQVPYHSQVRAGQASQFNWSFPGNHPLIIFTGMWFQQRELRKKPGLGEIQVVDGLKWKKYLPLEFYFFPTAGREHLIFWM